MTHQNATISNNRNNTGGGVRIYVGGNFTMTAGNIINNVSPGMMGIAGGGGVWVDGNGANASFTMTGGRISNNTALGTPSLGSSGGGIGLCCYSIVYIGGNAQIYGNTAQGGGTHAGNGGGIHMGWLGHNVVTITSGTIQGNNAVRGGGIHTGSATVGMPNPPINSLTIQGGVIRNNTASQDGGGVFVSPHSVFNMPGGNIIRNHASNDGGGVFVAHNNNQLIPAFTIGTGAIFNQNVAGNGMGANHVMNTLNPQVAPNIVTVNPNIPGVATVPITAHPFTNHDINANGPEYGWHVGNVEIDPDWLRLNYAINILSPAPATIIIHEATAPGQVFSSDWHDIPNSTFHLVIRDPNANAAYAGRTITTLPILLPSPAPAANPHRISVTRNVAIRAAEGANIILRMPVTGFTNVANAAPWNVGVTPNLGRHFIVSTNPGSLTTGNLTLGSVTGTGTLTLDGNRTIAATEHPGNRGGIIVEDAGTLTMRPGSTVMNGRADSGGGVLVSDPGSTFIMTGGTIGHATNPTQGNQAINGGGVHVTSEATFYMQDYVYIDGNNQEQTITGTGRIAGNSAIGTTPILTGNGGGVDVTGNGSTFNMSRGTIENNTSDIHGGGVNVMNFSTFNMSGGHIRNNEASTGVGTIGNGGGIHLHNGVTVNMSGGIVGDDNSNYGNIGNAGGGVVISSNIVEGSVFNMLAPAEGEAPPRIVGNTAYSDAVNQGGGGIEIWQNPNALSPSIFNMYAGIIERNYAYHGGGVYVEGGTFNMHGGIIQDNRYNPSGGDILYGGGVKFGNTAAVNFTMTGGIIRGNRATQGGGVRVRVAAPNIAHFIMSGGYIYRNEATTNGGGVYLINTNASFTMTGGVIGGTTPAHANTATNGGGVWVGGGAIFNMNQGGGGANPITNGTISGNTAQDGGGGVFVGGTNTTFNMYSGTIGGTAATYANSAPAGGGVMVDSGIFNLRSTNTKLISRNTATFGGGVWVGANATMVTNPGSSGVQITNNAVTQRGGGIYSAVAEYGNPLTRLTGANRAYHNLFLRDVLFTGNTAGHREFSPSNALDVMPRPVEDWMSLSTCVHPFNNYDINFIGEFGLPLTGGLGGAGAGWPVMWSITGTMLLVTATAMIVVVKKRKVTVVDDGVVEDGFIKDGKMHRFTKLKHK